MLFCFLLLFALPRLADLSLGGIVLDNNGLPVREALVRLENPTNQQKWETATNQDGTFQFDRLELGSYHLAVKKEGFFDAQTDVRLESNKIVEFTIAPLTTVHTEVEVIARPDPINVETVAAQQTVNDEVIQNIPYTGRRNFLNAIALMPGVLRDNSGQIHMHGSRADQIRYQLDGMNVTDPSTGTIAANIPIDAIESVDLDMAGYSAELGKGSGGVVRVNSQFINDRFRWDLTDFIPGINFRRKTLAELSPRLLSSGPMIQNKLWFMYAGSLRYVRTFNEDLPESENRQIQSIVDQLLKLKWNIRESHTVTANILHNAEYFGNLGLSIYRPVEATTNFLRRGTTVALTDRAVFGRALLETSLQWSRRRDSDLPRGTRTLRVRPQGWRGNFYSDRRGRMERVSANQSVAWERRLGSVTHRFKLGGSFDYVHSRLTLGRRSFEVRSVDDVLLSLVSFDGANTAGIHNREYGVFFQNRMMFSPAFQLELGLRLDREHVVGRTNLGPRAAFSLLPLGTDRSKVSGGIGVFYDNLALINLQLPNLQRRFTTYYDETGQPSAVELPTATRVSETLRNPAGVHWNVSWEHEWLPRWVSRMSLIQKVGRDQVRVAAVRRNDAFDLVFNNSGRADYRAVELALDRPIRTNLRFTVSYIYSKATARPSLSLDFPDPAVESSPERPAEWDIPHRIVSWGYFPLPAALNASYSVEARSGFPYTVYDQLNLVVGDYNGRRMLSHIVTNFSIEREMPMPFNKRIAFRIGVLNIFNRFNPRYVDANTASPTFGRFSDSSNRHFVGRVRLIRK